MMLIVGKARMDWCIEDACSSGTTACCGALDIFFIGHQDWYGANVAHGARRAVV